MNVTGQAAAAGSCSSSMAEIGRLLLVAAAVAEGEVLGQAAAANMGSSSVSQLTQPASGNSGCCEG